MQNLRKLKRDMLRAAVRENVEHLDGSVPKGLNPRRRMVRSILRLAAVVVVPAALFVSINAISGSSVKSELVVVSDAAKPAAPLAISTTALAKPQRIEPNVFRLAIQKIVVDPGHGGNDPGAKTAAGLTEKAVTLDVAERLRALLVDASFQVAMTREGDVSRSLRERAFIANEAHGDVFVSIHVNSIPTRDRRGVETYVLGATSDPHVTRLAGEENRESGYALSDYRKLLEGVYVDVRQSESRKFAESVQAGLFRGLRRASPGLENRGVKSAPFVVLVATEMPGILAEVSCVSNEEEAARLGDPRYRQGIARALFDGIREYAEVRNRPESRAVAAR